MGAGSASSTSERVKGAPPDSTTAARVVMDIMNSLTGSRTYELAWWLVAVRAQSSETTTDLTLVYEASASGPYSRPKPESFTPPKGIAGSSIAQSLIQTMPA